MIERVRSVNKIVLVALTLVLAILTSLSVSSMLAPSAWAGHGGGGAGNNQGTGKPSHDTWVLGDADAKDINDVTNVFIYGNKKGWQGCAYKHDNDPSGSCSGGVVDSWISAFTNPNDNWSGNNANHTMLDPGQNRSRLQKALDEAIYDCQEKARDQWTKEKPTTCNKPRVVAMGVTAFRNPNDNKAGCNKIICCMKDTWCLSTNSGNLTHTIFGVFGEDRIIKINGNDVKIKDPLAGTHSIEGDSREEIDKTNRNFAVIVVGEFQYEQNGWYPTYVPHERVDVASANKISSQKFAPCAAYYYMTATGIDGHVRGYTTKTVKYHTPYGKLYDAVQQGKTWKSYGPFIGDWSHDAAKLKELQEARDVACNETQNMKLVFNYGASGSSPDATESDEPTHTPGRGSSSTITVLGKDNFEKRFAKGGIYKIVKSKKDATLTAKTTDVKYFYRNSNWYEFVGWHDCKKNDTITADMMGLKGWPVSPSVINNWSDNKDNKCGYIGQDKPSSPPSVADSVDMRDDYNNGTTHATADGKDHGFYEGDPYDPNYYGKSAHWNEATDPRTIKDIKDLSDHIYVDGKERELSVVFNRGYVTKFNCGGVDVTADQVGQNQDMNTQSNCVASDWAFTNDIIGYWQAVTVGKQNIGNLVLKWIPGGKEAWDTGMPSVYREGNDGKWIPNSLHNEAIKTLNDQLHPVGNRYQSIVAIAYQDFLNVNCNKRDFDAFVNQVSTDAVNAGIPENLTLRANVTTNTKYNGRANTGIITQELVDSLHWNGLPQIVPRMLGQNQITISYGSSGADRYVNGLTPEQVTGTPDRSKVKVRVKAADGHLQYIPWVEYIRQISPAYSNYWKHYDASTDPVYSKECPFDCTDDRASTNDTAKNNVMADRNNPTQDDADHGHTGVLATDNTSNGSISDARGLSVNTANMVFFRNNEWNQFVVDLYTPKSGTNNAGDISYDGGPVSDGKNGPAKSTIITRDPDGTPWFAADASKTVLTHLQPTTGAYAGKDIFTNKPGETSVGFGQQLSIPTETATTGINQTSVQLSGQINSFKIKSAWATENGKPLRFQMKWEYNANDHVSVPSTISFKGTGTTTGNIPGDVYREDTIATAVDGKCLGQQNTLNHTPDTTDLNHDNSGSGTNDNDDTTFDTNPLAGSGAPRGWFEINFVRATAE